MTLVLLHKLVLTHFEGVEKNGKGQGGAGSQEKPGKAGGGGGEQKAHQAPGLPVSQRVLATLFLGDLSGGTSWKSAAISHAITEDSEMES